MLKIKNIPLRYSIPFGILLFNLILLTVDFYSSKHRLTSQTINKATEQIRETGLLLSMQIESSIRNNNIADARQSVNQISGFKNITNVLLADENQNIIAANDFSLEGQNILKVSDSIFTGISLPQLNDYSLKIVYDESNRILYSYNQIFIGTTEGSFLPNLTGQLIITKNLTEELRTLQLAIWQKAKINFAMYFAFSFFIWLIFNFVFLRRIVNIVNAFKNPTQLNIKFFEGRDEISELASEFLRIHNQLNETLTRYKTILNSSSVAIAEVNVEGKYLFVNKTWQELFGFNATEALGMQTNILLHPDQEPSQLYQELRSGQIHNYTEEIKYQHKNGKEVWCNLYVSENKDDQGNLISFVGIMQDITEKKQTQEAIEEQEKKFQLLFKNMTLGVTYQNNKGEITDANPAACKILGLKLEQIQGKTHLDYGWKSIHEDGSDYLGETHPGILALKTGKPVLNKIMGIINASQNKYRWIKIDAIPQFRDGEKAAQKVFTTFDDITEQKEIRDEIARTQELFRLLANNTNDLICLQEPDSTFKYISPSIKTILGYESADFLGKKVFNIAHKDDILPLKKAMANNIFMSKTMEAFSFRVRHKEGHYVWLEFLCSPIYKKEVISYYVTSARDITQWVLAKEEIQEYQTSLQKLTTEITLIEEEQKKDIAANIHDHLSQSLVISKMKIKELLKDGSLKKINADLKFIETHISEALENSRKITFELSPPALYHLGIIDALQWLLEDLEVKHKIKFQFNDNVTNIELPDVKSILLYRSIQEALTNAIKYAKASLITVTINKNNSGILIQITDNGVGFDTSILSNLKNHTGSGFGLFAVQERIRNIQGKFTILSEIGEGTTVKIEIPYTE